MASGDITTIVKIELSEADRSLLMRLNQNMEWYRQHVKEQQDTQMRHGKELDEDLRHDAKKHYEEQTDG